MIDFRLMVWRLIHRKLRIEFWLEWFYALLFGLEYIQGVFTAYRSEVLFRMSYPNSTICLEQLLQIETGNPLVTIGWLDSSLTDFIVSPTAYNQDQPLLPPTGDGPIMRIDGDTVQLYGAGFIVNAPGSNADEVLIREIVDRYNHAGVLYELNFA